jgi:capsular polysaccharide transport system permease protein
MLILSGRRSVSPVGGPAELFLTTGLYSLYLFLYVSRRLRIPPPRRRLPIEKRLDFIFVHLLIRTVDFSLLGVVLFGVLYFVSTDRAIPGNLTALFAAYAAIVTLAFGWLTFTQTIVAMFPRRGRALPIIFAIVSRSLIFFSGVFYMAEFFPPHIREYISFNPMFHAVTLFRMAFYPKYPHLLFDGTYLTYCCLASVVLGLIMERITSRHEITERT